MTYFKLPGGRFASESRRELPALAAAVVRFMGAGSRAPRAAVGDALEFAAKSAEWSRSVLSWLDIDLDLTGTDQIDWARPHVIVALHEGIIDPLFLMAHLPVPLRFVARTELKDWPVIGPILEPSGQILIEPEQPHSAARTLLRGGRQAVAAGFSPVVFAQGTLLGIETAFQPGAFALARAAGVEVLPVVIAGTHQVYEWPFSPVVRRSRPVHVQILPSRVNPKSSELESEMRHIALDNKHAPVRRFDPIRDGWWDDYRFSISADYPGLASQMAKHRSECVRA